MKEFFNTCNTSVRIDKDGNGSYESTKTLHEYVFLNNHKAFAIGLTLAIQARKFDKNG